jgi:2-hydroxychromene-2-carboxylate isomerase
LKLTTTNQLSYIPIFLGGIMQACGNTPPIKVKSASVCHRTIHPPHPSTPPSKLAKIPLTTTLPDKNEYITHDRTRLAALLRIPIIANVPTPFPPNTLPAQRALCTIQNHHPVSLPAAFEALYQAFWVEGQPIGEPGVVVKVLGKVVGEERAGEIVEGTKKEEVKRLLNGNTDAALGAGVFGVPFFVARKGDGEEGVFFGVDRVGMVADFLGLGRGEDEGGGGIRALL